MGLFCVDLAAINTTRKETMTFEQEHVLLWHVKKLRCHLGHEIVTHSTDHGHCSCGGWECWAKSRSETEDAHRNHREFIRRQTPQTTACELPSLQVQHDLRVSGEEGEFVGRCDSCGWSLRALQRHNVEAAFREHVKNLSK